MNRSNIHKNSLKVSPRVRALEHQLLPHTRLGAWLAKLNSCRIWGVCHERVTLAHIPFLSLVRSWTRHFVGSLLHPPLGLGDGVDPRFGCVKNVAPKWFAGALGEDALADLMVF